MKKSLFYAIFGLLAMLSSFTVSGKSDSIAQNRRDSLLRIRTSREVLVDGKIGLRDIRTPAGEVDTCLYIPRQHPVRDSIPVSIRDQVAQRNRLVGKDSLSGSELFWVLRPHLLWLQNIDPHLRIDLQPRLASYTRKAMKQANNIPVPGFTLLNVGDTLVVDQTVDPLFRRGDRILSINNIPAPELLQYCYDDRCVYPFVMLKNCRFELVTASDFRIGFERDGQVHSVTIPGMPWADAWFALSKQSEFQTRIFPAEKAGYFSIREFYPNNSLLINKLRKAILDAKKQGCESFILDLRGNPGGNGDSFDKLLSIFIDRDTISYMKAQRLRVSEETRHDYEFLTDSMMGRLVDMPDAEINREVPLRPKMYIPGMRYYVLMNKDTGSVAATFCNIMQYNGAARLVGEPLRRNAVRYGEVLDARWLYLTPLMLTSVSTMEFDEHTRAVDGVLMPDIAIPYRAADYLSGQDAMLDNLLAMLRAESPSMHSSHR